MIKGIARKRIGDRWGQGHYGASRGSRTHNGIDYVLHCGTTVLSPVEGTVTKIGYPYSDDLSYKYIQITSEDGFQHRIFYCCFVDCIEN